MTDSPDTNMSANQDASPVAPAIKWVRKRSAAENEIKDRFEAARPLGYCAAHSPNAQALIEAITARIIENEQQTGQRGNERKAAGRVKLTKAVEHFVGGILRGGLADNEMTSRSMANNKNAFLTSGGVAYRQAVSAIDGLSRLGLIVIHPGYHYSDKGDGEMRPEGRDTRFEALPALVDLASQHGITAATVGKDFKPFFPETLTAPSPLVVIRRSKHRRDELVYHDAEGLFVVPEGDNGGADLPLPAGSQTDEQLRLVAFARETLSRHSFTGCLPPQLYRVFIESYALHGRWYAEGGPKGSGIPGYTSMQKIDRPAITVDGERMVEVDISASYLTAAHGLLGLLLPGSQSKLTPTAQDLYALPNWPDISRDLVKLVVVVAFGRGKLTKTAPNGSDKLLRRSNCTWKEAVDAVCAVYPFLRDATEALKGPLGLEELAAYGPPERLLVHRLTAREADALTGAAEMLWRDDIPVLPLHDALIVPESRCDYAAQTLGLSFHGKFGVTPRIVKLERAYLDF